MCKWGELYLKSYLQKIKRKKYVSQWKRRKHQEKLINLYNDRNGRGWCFPTNLWSHLFTMYKNTWKQGTWGKLLTDLWTWLEVDSIIIYGGQRTPKFTMTGLQKRNRISFCLHRAEKSCSFFRLTRNIWFYSKRFRRQTWSSLSVQVSPRSSYEVY